MKDQKDKQCRFIFLQPVLIIFTMPFFTDISCSKCF